MRQQSRGLNGCRVTSTSVRATPYQLSLLQGPKETPFEDGSFELSITVPEQYPLVPPAVRYKTKIFHPNVHFKVSQPCFPCTRTAVYLAHVMQARKARNGKAVTT